MNDVVCSVYSSWYVFFTRCLMWVFFYQGNLWYRQGVTPSYPQGSSWEHVSNNVRKVSVGPLDQVGHYGTTFIHFILKS